MVGEGQGQGEGEKVEDGQWEGVDWGDSVENAEVLMDSDMVGVSLAPSVKVFVGLGKEEGDTEGVVDPSPTAATPPLGAMVQLPALRVVEALPVMVGVEEKEGAMVQLPALRVVDAEPVMVGVLDREMVRVAELEGVKEDRGVGLDRVLEGLVVGEGAEVAPVSPGTASPTNPEVEGREHNVAGARVSAQGRQYTPTTTSTPLDGLSPLRSKEILYDAPAERVTP